MSKQFILDPGENTRLDLQRDLNNGTLLILRQPKQTTHVRLSREKTIGLALALLEGAGVPVQEAFNRQLAARVGSG